jgi:glycosyltransferase involved in cell wall biosynthesis
MTFNKDNQLVSIVFPAYNEEGNITALYDLITKNLPDKYNYEFIFVDDGSTDKTLELIKSIALVDKRVNYLSFSRNFGHQYALKAGLDYCNGDCAISMDSDLQHPPTIISEMLQLWDSGYDVVYTIREDDKNISIIKRLTSNLFYVLLNKLSNVELKKGAADFRLTDRKVIEILKNDITEYFLFIRGMIAWVGFNQIGLVYQPSSRYSGKTKYSISKMIRFAIDGITSFSNKPLRISMYLGFLLSFISFFMLLTL